MWDGKNDASHPQWNNSSFQTSSWLLEERMTAIWIPLSSRANRQMLHFRNAWAAPAATSPKSSLVQLGHFWVSHSNDVKTALIMITRSESSMTLLSLQLSRKLLPLDAVPPLARMIFSTVKCEGSELLLKLIHMPLNYWWIALSSIYSNVCTSYNEIAT